MNSFEFLHEGELIAGGLEREGEHFRVTVGETTYQLHPVGENLYTASVNGSRVNVAVKKYKDTIYVDIDSVLIELREATEDNVAGGAGDHGGDKDKIYAPMPGKIVKILVGEGDEVEQGQGLVVVEAMKMENEIRAALDGTVKTVHVTGDQTVNKGDPLVTLE